MKKILVVPSSLEYPIISSFPIREKARSLPRICYCTMINNNLYLIHVLFVICPLAPYLYNLLKKNMPYYTPFIRQVKI
jgi:hypothetical protein